MARRRINPHYLTNHQAQAGERRPVWSLPARILGVDAALRCTGYGLCEILAGGELRVLDCGVIRTSREQRLSDCLRRLRGGIQQLLEAGKPTAAALEGGFFHRNAKTAMVLGAARGVVLATIAEHGVPIYEYAPRQVKQAICGYGNAAKTQVALMVAQRLGLAIGQIDDDATDALAVALCHFGVAGTQDGLFLPEPS